MAKITPITVTVNIDVRRSNADASAFKLERELTNAQQRVKALEAELARLRTEAANRFITLIALTGALTHLIQVVQEAKMRGVKQGFYRNKGLWDEQADSAIQSAEEVKKASWQ